MNATLKDGFLASMPIIVRQIDNCIGSHSNDEDWSQSAITYAWHLWVTEKDYRKDLKTLAQKATIGANRGKMLGRPIGTDAMQHKERPYQTVRSGEWDSDWQCSEFQVLIERIASWTDEREYDFDVLPDILPQLEGRLGKIATMLAAGKTRVVIAKELGIAPSTLQYHLARLERAIVGIRKTAGAV